MANDSLREALRAVLESELQKVSDRILRVDASIGWPVADALRDLSAASEVRILVRRPFGEADFKGLTVTIDPGLATRWRNEKPRAYSVIVVGGTTGNLDAGLKDIRGVDRRTIVATWRERVIGALGDVGDLAKVEFRALLQELFDSVGNGLLDASQLEAYINHVKSVPSVENISSSLWMVGLAPDSQILDRSQARQRVRRNREILETLRASEDAKVNARLAKAKGSSDAEQKAVAKAAITYRADGSEEALKQLSLPGLDAIFASSPNAPTAKSTDLTGLLNCHIDSASAVRQAFAQLADEWVLDESQTELVATFDAKGETQSVRVELEPPRLGGEDMERFARPWTEERGDQVLAARSSASQPEPLGEGQQVLTGSAFRDQAKLSGVASSAVATYLSARAGLATFEPWLDSDAWKLLLLKAEARDAAQKYIDAWAALVAATLKLEEAPDFAETIQILETVQGPLDGNEPTWATLGPLHPFRLDPLVRLAMQTADRVSGDASVEKLGDAVTWALDRCYPAYPSIHVADKTLTLSSMNRGMLVYARRASQFMPQARDASGLDRVLRAIEHYSTWLEHGLTALVIDPPQGGAVSKVLEAARRRPEGRPVFVYHLATTDASDTLDHFEGSVRFLPREQKLSDVARLPDANVILRFVPENPSGHQVASQSAATKGAHLALELSESQANAFGTERTPQVKIDPRNGNIVVRSMQELFKRLTGGRPSLATIRPLLQTDDAKVLSRLASGTDWLIFAAPGPLGLVSPKTINSTLRFVGRASMGQYGLYVYAANDLYPVRRHFEEFFRKTPAGTGALSPEKMVDLLVDKAQTSGHAVLFASVNGANGVHGQVASMVALDIATEDAGSEDQVFVLNLDDLGWTRAWLKDGFRADFVVVRVSPEGNLFLRVVESKSVQDGVQVPCESSQPHFKEAIEQIGASTKALKDIVLAASPTLDEDLRFASLVEHLMAAVLARSGEMKQGAERKRIFDVVNAFSRRELIPTFEGLAVLTQVGVTAPRQVVKLNTGERLVWAGAPELAKTFKMPPAQNATAGVSSGSSRPGGQTVEKVRQEAEKLAPGVLSGSRTEADSSPLGSSTTNASRAVSLPTSERISSHSDGVPDSDEIATLANKFIAASKIHAIPVSGSKPTYVEVGPSLFSVGIKLKEGSSLQPLRARLGDIARDIGLGDRANTIEVENDAEPGTVRVLMPRPNRIFPELPPLIRSPLGEVGYLPLHLGQSVEGNDYVSSVESWPHLLVAGTSGSGKTTFMKTLLTQLAAFGGDALQLAVVDGKGDTDYMGLVPPPMFPAAFPEVQLGHSTATDVLRWVVEEMERRRQLIVELARQSPSPQGVKSVDLYRHAIERGVVPEIKPLVLIIDEFADIMLAGKKSADEFENLIQRVAQVGRSRLVHLVLATQRPDKETIRGAIKANLNARAVFRLPTQADSMTVMGQAGADRLMLHGDFLLQHGSGIPIRLQGYRV